MWWDVGCAAKIAVLSQPKVIDAGIRAILGGRVSKSTTSVMLTTNVLKKRLGVALTPEEEDTEASYQKDGNGY